MLLLLLQLLPRRPLLVAPLRSRDDDLVGVVGWAAALLTLRLLDELALLASLPLPLPPAREASGVVSRRVGAEAKSARPPEAQTPALAMPPSGAMSCRLRPKALRPSNTTTTASSPSRSGGGPGGRVGKGFFPAGD